MSNASNEFKSLRILHISDLHFGGDHGFTIPRGKTDLGTSELDLAEVIVEDLNSQSELPVDAVIVSGDLMTHARWLEHSEDALVVLQKLQSKLSLTVDRVFIIPGNHDYEWYQEQATGGFLRKALDPSQTSSFTHEVHYRNFLMKFYGDQRTLSGEVFIIPGDRFALKLGLLDSCKLVPSQFHEYGYLSLGQIKTVIKKLQDNASGIEVRALIMHHHVSSVLPAEPPRDKANVSVTLDAGRLIDRALDAEVGLVLHGHQHYPCVTKINKTTIRNRMLQRLPSRDVYVLSAGSAGVKPERRAHDIPNTYSIISIGLGGCSVKVRAIFSSGDDGTTLADEPLDIHFCSSTDC